jgi:glutaredoxin
MVDVKVLATPNCSNCAQVKKYLDALGVKYKVFDVTKHPDMLAKYPIMSSPGLVVGGKLVSQGMISKDKLEKLLK